MSDEYTTGTDAATEAFEANLPRYRSLRWLPVRLAGQRLSLLAAGIRGAGPPARPEEDAPVWAEIWPGGLALAEYLLQGPPLRGPALELGAGVGVVGLALALRGGCVVQTDLVTDALCAASLNARRAGVADRMRQVAADWRAWPLRRRFSLVVGGDITYDPETHAALFDVVRRSVTAGGTLLLADPGRPATERFARRLLAAGWRVTEYPLASSAPGSAPVRLIRAQATEGLAPNRSAGRR